MNKMIKFFIIVFALSALATSAYARTIRVVVNNHSSSTLYTNPSYVKCMYHTKRLHYFIGPQKKLKRNVTTRSTWKGSCWETGNSRFDLYIEKRKGGKKTYVGTIRYISGDEGQLKFHPNPNKKFLGDQKTSKNKDKIVLNIY